MNNGLRRKVRNESLKIFKNQITFNLKQLCLVYKTWVRALLNLKILIVLAKYHTFLLI